MLTGRGAPRELAIVLHKAPEREASKLLAVGLAGHLRDYALGHLQHFMYKVSGSFLTAD